MLAMIKCSDLALVKWHTIYFFLFPVDTCSIFLYLAMLLPALRWSRIEGGVLIQIRWCSAVSVSHFLPALLLSWIMDGDMQHCVFIRHSCSLRFMKKVGDVLCTLPITVTASALCSILIQKQKFHMPCHFLHNTTTTTATANNTNNNTNNSIAIPSKRNTFLNVTGKLSTYKEVLHIKINRMWCMKTEIIPVVFAVQIRTAHILQRVLSSSDFLPVASEVHSLDPGFTGKQETGNK